MELSLIRSVLPPKSAQRLDQQLALLEAALQQKQIRTVEYAELKQRFPRLLEEAYRLWVINPLFELPMEKRSGLLADLYFDLGCGDMVAVASSSKKLAKVRLEGQGGVVAEFVGKMKAFFDETQPLVQAMNDVKPFIVKGRVLRETPVPENPDKVERTCGCCLRKIAVTPNRLMAHHGYRRPMVGMQTASCPGIDFPPLEVSSLGLEYREKMTASHIERLNEKLLKADTLQTLPLRVYKGEITIGPDHPQWNLQLATYRELLSHELWHASRELGEVRERLAAWQPTETVEALDAALGKRNTPKKSVDSLSM